MINIILNIKLNSIISIWKDGSITWLPLNRYTFKAEQDYSVVEQNGFAGYSEPRIMKGSALNSLLIKLGAI